MFRLIALATLAAAPALAFNPIDFSTKEGCMAQLEQELRSVRPSGFDEAKFFRDLLATAPANLRAEVSEVLNAVRETQTADRARADAFLALCAAYP